MVPPQPKRTRLLLLVSAFNAAVASRVPAVISPSFAVISDWGGTDAAPYTTAGQLACAEALDSVITADSLAFVVSGGNNFMPSGLPAAADNAESENRFTSTWQDVYTSDVTWYLTGGYMDWMGNATAERAFTWTEPRWQYPDLWHTFTVPLAVSGETLQIILVRMDARTHAGNPLPRQGIPHQQAGGAEIFSFTAASGQVDTVTLAGAMLNNPGIVNIPLPAVPGPVVGPSATTATAAGSTPQAVPAATAAATAPVTASATAAAPAAGRRRLRDAGGEAKRWGRKLRDFNLDGNPPIATLQWTWLETALNASTANWIVVVGNDPIWSVGQHGPTWALVDQLLPLLNQHGVSLYISGRDPIAQHIAPSATYPNIDFVGTGNGAFGNASQAQQAPSLANNPANSLRFVSGQDSGFVTVAHSGSAANMSSQLTVSYYDSTGAQLYAFTKGNPRKMPIIPLDEQGGVETVLDMDSDKATVSPVVAGLCMFVIVAVICVAVILNRDEDDDKTKASVNKILKEKEAHWGPPPGSRAAASMGVDQEGGQQTSVVRGGTATSAAERRPLLPKNRAAINTDL